MRVLSGQRPARLGAGCGAPRARGTAAPAPARRTAWTYPTGALTARASDNLCRRCSQPWRDLTALSADLKSNGFLGVANHPSDGNEAVCPRVVSDGGRVLREGFNPAPNTTGCAGDAPSPLTPRDPLQPRARASCASAKCPKRASAQAHQASRRLGGFKFEAQRFLLDQALFLRTLLPV